MKNYFPHILAALTTCILGVSIYSQTTNLASNSIVHPKINWLDSLGKSTGKSHALPSLSQSCGTCHDHTVIAKTLQHRGGFFAANSKKKTKILPKEESCLLCHTSVCAEIDCHTGTGNSDESSALRQQLEKWLIQKTENDSLTVVGVNSSACMQCHSPQSLTFGRQSAIKNEPRQFDPSWTNALVYTGKEIHLSTLNVKSKDSLQRPIDVHAQRGLECASCHSSPNHPAHYVPTSDKKLSFLDIDARRPTLGQYLKQPSHNFLSHTNQDGENSCLRCHKPIQSHSFLPKAKEHLEKLACQVCHIPGIYTPVAKTIDWTKPSMQVEYYQESQSLSHTEAVKGLSPQIVPMPFGKSWKYMPVVARTELSLLKSTHDNKDTIQIGTTHDTLMIQRLFQSVNHQITLGKYALRNCQSCHSKNSILQKAPIFEDEPPLSKNQKSFSNHKLVIGYTSPITSNSKPYVWGKDRIKWADTLGIISFWFTIFILNVHLVLRIKNHAFGGEQDSRSTNRAYTYTVYERFWHWVQAMVIMVLLGTGLVMHYSLGHGALKVSIYMHTLFGILLLLNAFLALFYHVTSGEIRQFLPEPKGLLGRVISQQLYYLRGIFKGEEHPFHKTPERKLNPLQQIAYLILLNGLLPLQIVTGMILWQHTYIGGIDRFGGLELISGLHTLGNWLMLTFLAAHLYLTTTGPTPLSYIIAMITGWEKSSHHRKDL